MSMSELQAKPVCASRTEQVQIILPQHINGYQRLFGGQLVAWMDIVAGVVARRHTNSNVTTVAIDHLQFKAAAYVNDIIVLIGKMTYVGRTSMEIRVDAYVESVSGKQKLVNTAYFVMVAIDFNEMPAPAPGLILETEEDKIEWEAGQKRYKLRQQRKQEQF